MAARAWTWRRAGRGAIGLRLRAAHCSVGSPEERTCRLDKIRRRVWDGQQELYEIQMPADSGLQLDQPWSACTESDTAYLDLAAIKHVDRYLGDEVVTIG